MHRAPCGRHRADAPLRGWPAPGKPPPACARIHLRIPDSGEEARSPRTHRAAFRVDREPRVGSLLASRGARRPRPPGSASIGSPLSWGSVSTVSICNSIAPHGRARPRAVTQMALGDLRITYLPQSASSPRELLRPSRSRRNTNRMASDGRITADERSALRGCGCITRQT